MTSKGHHIPSSTAVSHGPGAVYSKVVVKLGTGLLTHGGNSLNDVVMEDLAGQIAHLHEEGLDVVVVSSGAVAAGRYILGAAPGLESVVQRQALAAVGQVELMRRYARLFAGRDRPIPVAQAMLTRRDIVSDRLSYLNARNTLLALLRQRVIPIINENDVVAVDEIVGQVFGDNDNLSAMVANLVDADLLVMLGEVDGLYTSDPRLNPSEAEFVPRVENVDAAIRDMAGPSADDKGRGGMVTKLEAARVASQVGTNVVICSGLTDGVLDGVVFGSAEDGAAPRRTVIPASGTKTESRRRWMVAGKSQTGHVIVDEGASNAVTNSNRSLLPAGVTSIYGVFERGDIVPIWDSSREIAAGFCNYSAQELERIKGVQSADIEAILGYEYGAEVVHRNNMMVFAQPPSRR